MVEFSLVCPIRNEVDLIPITLPSFFMVEPSEVLLCLDKPAPKNVVEVINKVTSFLGVEDLTRIIEVERNPEYKFHQAWVRRKGFLEAKHDRILTTDIDLVINRNVLKAVEMVGKNNVGLVSCSKARKISGFTSFYRYLAESFLRKIVHRLLAKFYKGGGLSATSFTGLYAIWRPYWLDTEKEIKKLVNPKSILLGEKVKLDITQVYPIGEDTYLRDCMAMQYSVVYLPDIGAACLTEYLEDSPFVQFWIGFYFASRGRSLLGALVRTILRLQAHYLCGHLSSKRFLKHKYKSSRQYSLEDARRYWKYAPLSLTVGGSKPSTDALIRQPDMDLKRVLERSILERNIKEGAIVYRRKILEWIKKELVKNMLDFGCGTGQDGVYFAINGGVAVDFADIVESNVTLTKKYNRIWDISASSIFIDTEPEEFEFPMQYDMMLANGVLHHTPKAKEIVQNLNRFLKCNGLFICMLYTPKHFKATKARNIEEYARLSEAFAPIQNPYSDYYDLAKAKRLFEGFELLETFTTHQEKFGWYVWRKKCD